MSEHKLPFAFEPWDGRIVDANDMYVDREYVLHMLNHHAELVEALRSIDLDMAADWGCMELEDRDRAKALLAKVKP